MFGMTPKRYYRDPKITLAADSIPGRRTFKLRGPTVELECGADQVPWWSSASGGGRDLVEPNALPVWPVGCVWGRGECVGVLILLTRGATV